MSVKPLTAALSLAAFVLALYCIFFKESVPTEALAFEADFSLRRGTRVDGRMVLPSSGDFKLFLALDESSASEAERVASLIRGGWRDHDGPPGVVLRLSLEVDGRPVPYEARAGFKAGYLMHGEGRILLARFELEAVEEYSMSVEVLESVPGLETAKCRLIVRPDPFAASDAVMRNVLRPWVGFLLAACAVLSIGLSLHSRRRSR